MKSLKYSTYGSFIHTKVCDSFKNPHPQIGMRELGISYEHSTPQSIGDCWWFWDCKNIPDILPPYLTYIDLDPMECIGFGLDEATAKRLSK